MTSLLAVVGATGTGKSDLSLALAAASAAHGQEAEIINADAMQLYRGMDIGTAKLTPQERAGVPHHLLDVLDVTQEASVATYQRVARSAIDAAIERGHRPILVGGSGLYVSAVIYDFQFPERDPELRARLEVDLERDGTEAMFARLMRADPGAAEAIGQHNARRIIRALEAAELTGTSISGRLPGTELWRPTTVLGLQLDRAALVERLDARVERMWRAGLVAEVAHLVDQGFDEGSTARKAIGYAQARSQLRGELGESDAIEQTRALTRRYARRQVSWFRRYEHIRWFDVADPAATERAIGAAGLALSHGD